MVGRGTLLPTCGTVVPTGVVTLTPAMVQSATNKHYAPIVFATPQRAPRERRGHVFLNGSAFVLGERGIVS
jgi:hypothetical protein